VWEVTNRVRGRWVECDKEEGRAKDGVGERGVWGGGGEVEVGVGGGGLVEGGSGGGALVWGGVGVCWGGVTRLGRGVRWKGLVGG